MSGRRALGCPQAVLYGDEASESQPVLFPFVEQNTDRFEGGGRGQFLMSCFGLESFSSEELAVLLLRAGRAWQGAVFDSVVSLIVLLRRACHLAVTLRECVWGWGQFLMSCLLSCCSPLQNYESCFVRSDADPRAAFDASQPYEILNSSGMSQLVFHGAGRFQFVLKVVDPALRYVYPLIGTKAHGRGGNRTFGKQHDWNEY